MLKLIVTAAALAALVPTTTFAQTEARQVQVSFADLNLSSEAGKAQLNRRIETAVRKVCGEESSGGLQRIATARECMAKTRANAQAAVKAKLAAHNATPNVVTAAADPL